MAKVDEDLRRYLGKQLRRLFRYSPVKRLAKIELTQCAECQDEGYVEIDHNDPVAPVDREVNSLEYFKRMFCLLDNGEVDLSNLIALCKEHHREKSRSEMSQRAFHKTGPYSQAAKDKRRKKIKKIRLGRGKRKYVSARRKKTRR